LNRNEKIMKRLLVRLLYRILPFFFVMILAVLYACSDKPLPKASGANVPIKSAPSDPAYLAVLSDGIDFTKPDYPAFVAETQGISGNEPWGRWTDGDRTIIKFKDNLPLAFYLELVVSKAFGPNVKKPVRIRVGGDEQTFTVTQIDEIFRFEFVNMQNANTIEIIPPKPTSPKSMKVGDDERRVGIGLAKLRIIEKGK
jgi:hypothetical protein